MADILYFSLPIQRTSPSWEIFERHAIGVFVEGDRQMQPIRWWRELLNKWLKNCHVAVFEAGKKERLRGYRMGVARLDRDPLLCTKVVQFEAIAVPIWQSSFIAFITDPRGEEEGRLSLIRVMPYESAAKDGLPIVSV